MVTLRIYDLRYADGPLALDLRDLMTLLSPLSIQADWQISKIKSADVGYDWFDATGDGGEALERFADQDLRLTGRELDKLAHETDQVIWGEFSGFLPTDVKEPWITIRAIDSTFYEVITSDEDTVSKIHTRFEDVRQVSEPYVLRTEFFS